MPARSPGRGRVPSACVELDAGAAELLQVADRLSAKVIAQQSRETRVRFQLRGLRGGWLCSRRVGFPLFTIGLRVPNRLVFAVNRAMPLYLVATEVNEIAGMKVYGRRDGRGTPAAWLLDPQHRSCVTALRLRRDDYLHTALGSVSLGFEPRGVEEDVALLHRLLDLAEQLKSEREEDQFDRSGIPEGLRPLLERWRRFAVADDNERAEVIEEADDDELEALVADAGPALGQITDALSAYDVDVIPEALTPLGDLAQAVLEAQIALRERTGL